MLKTATAVWQRNHLRCLQVIEKLWQLGIIEAESVVEWAFKSLKAKATSSENTNLKRFEGHIEFKVLKVITERTVQKTGLL